MTVKHRAWQTLYQPKHGKPVKILVWKNRDFETPGQEVTFHSKCLKSWNSVFSFLTAVLEPRFGAVRKLYHLNTKKLVLCLRDILPNEKYVAVGAEKVKFKKNGYLTEEEKMNPRLTKSATSSVQIEDNITSLENFMEYTKKKKRTVVYFMVSGRPCQVPLKVVLIESDLLDYNMILEYLSYRLDVSEGIQDLYNIKGKVIHNLSELVHGDLYIAVPFNGKFVKLDYPQLFSELMPQKTIIVKTKGPKKKKGKQNVKMSPSTAEENCKCPDKTKLSSSAGELTQLNRAEYASRAASFAANQTEIDDHLEILDTNWDAYAAAAVEEKTEPLEDEDDEDEADAVEVSYDDYDEEPPEDQIQYRPQFIGDLLTDLDTKESIAVPRDEPQEKDLRARNGSQEQNLITRDDSQEEHLATSNESQEKNLATRDESQEKNLTTFADIARNKQVESETEKEPEPIFEFDLPLLQGKRRQSSIGSFSKKSVSFSYKDTPETIFEDPGEGPSSQPSSTDANKIAFDLCKQQRASILKPTEDNDDYVCLLAKKNSFRQARDSITVEKAPSLFRQPSMEEDLGKRKQCMGSVTHTNCCPSDIAAQVGTTDENNDESKDDLGDKELSEGVEHQNVNLETNKNCALDPHKTKISNSHLLHIGSAPRGSVESIDNKSVKSKDRLHTTGERKSSSSSLVNECISSREDRNSIEPKGDLENIEESCLGEERMSENGSTSSENNGSIKDNNLESNVLSNSLKNHACCPEKGKITNPRSVPNRTPQRKCLKSSALVQRSSTTCLGMKKRSHKPVNRSKDRLVSIKENPCRLGEKKRYSKDLLECINKHTCCPCEKKKLASRLMRSGSSTVVKAQRRSQESVENVRLQSIQEDTGSLQNEEVKRQSKESLISNFCCPDDKRAAKSTTQTELKQQSKELVDDNSDNSTNGSKDKRFEADSIENSVFDSAEEPMSDTDGLENRNNVSRGVQKNWKLPEEIAYRCIQTDTVLAAEDGLLVV